MSSSPVARRAAEALGVDIDSVEGSGPSGKVLKADVIAFAEGGQDPRARWLSQMMLIRRFEEAAGQGYNRAQIGGFLHLGIGEEACIVGSVAALSPSDYLFCTYRSHGHALARGTDPKAVMAELYGKDAGTSRGKGGSMHIFDAERRFMGGYGIVGGNIPLAAGVALAVKRQGEDSAVLCQFGDGAANTGNFSETLNMASLWNLPIVFMITNNQYGMGTALDRHAADEALYKRGQPYGIEGRTVDGMDVEETYQATSEALAYVKENQRPLVLEASTYRFRGHSAADPEVYRPKDEVEAWKDSRDPIAMYETVLLEEGLLSQAEIDQLRSKAEEAVLAAETFAAETPDPDPSELLTDVYEETENTMGALEAER